MEEGFAGFRVEASRLRAYSLGFQGLDDQRA